MARVLVITHGRVVHDGPLAGIVEQFGRHKLVKLQFEEDVPEDDWGRFGEVTRRVGPSIDLKVDRTRVSKYSPSSSTAISSWTSASRIRRWIR